MISEYVFYIYAYLRETDNTPYYIGKGKRNRAYRKHTFVSVPKDRSKIIFYQTGLPENAALYLEQAYIKLFGRKVNGGILLNITDGGEGVSGLKHTEATKQKMRTPKSAETKFKMSRAASKRKRPHKEETKIKIGNANRNRKLGPQSDTTKEKRRLAVTATWQDAEVRRKQSERTKLWWAERKAAQLKILNT